MKLLCVLIIAFLSVFPIEALAQPIEKSDLVDLFIGTAGDNGQVDPAACVPYGMVRVCPDMEPRSHVGYDYEIDKISGFSINRISGIGCSGAGGNLRLKPVRKDIYSTIKKSTESAYPGYYTVTLDNDVKVELTATNNIAIEKFHYPENSEAVLTLDATAGFEGIRESVINIISDTEIEGFITTGNTCNHGQYKLYYHASTSTPFQVLTHTNKTTELAFNPGDNPVEIRISLSAIDNLTAKEEKEKYNKYSFNELKNKAKHQWENILSKIDIKGATSEEETLFYTCLYRVFLSPANVTSFDNRFLTTNGLIKNTSDFTYYSSWSMWDSYRTKFPLITLLDPATMKDISISLCYLYKYGKKDWATNYESTPTVRTEHSIAVILDAYRKGIPFDLEIGYEGFKRDMETLQIQRPDQAFETCIDLWSMAEIATILNKTEDATLYHKKAKDLFITTWNNEFKAIDESFKKMRDNGLYQGTKWQYRWAVPQYLESMIESTKGGKESLAKQLDYFYANNLNNQTNEPGLHIPYIYNRLDQYQSNQKIVRKILTEEMTHLYGGNAEYPEPITAKTFTTLKKGFLPEMDEDDGTMAAYYVFGAIGLYPLIVGEPWYEITSPLYDEISINLPNDKQLTIKTKNRKASNDLIKRIHFNESRIKDFRIDHNKLVEGGTLLLTY